MYCKACGEQIDDDSKFCSHCGKKQFKDHNNDQSNKKVIKKTLDYNDLVYDSKKKVYYHKGKRYTGKAIELWEQYHPEGNEFYSGEHTEFGKSISNIENGKLHGIQETYIGLSKSKLNLISRIKHSKGTQEVLEEFHIDGNRRNITHYKDGYPIESETYLPGTDTLWIKNKYMDDVVTSEEYNYDGKLSRIKSIKHFGYRKVRVGAFKSFYENGNLREIGQYSDNGLQTGEWSFYHENGHLEQKGRFDINGKQTGIWHYYDEKGKLIYQVKLKKGKRDI